jgi:hypothetical protein
MASVAAEAARLLAEREAVDHADARRKAAQRLRVSNRREWPDNGQIDSALRQYQQLFLTGRQPVALMQLRQKALEVMAGLTAFQPRLIGSVLAGTADVDSVIEIHCFCDRCEDMLLYLMDRGIRWQESEQFCRYANGQKARIPCYRVIDGEGAEWALACFPSQALRSGAPLSAVTGRPEERADHREVERLIALSETLG